MSYSDLDRDRKQELLINSYAFGLACKNFAELANIDLRLIAQDFHSTASLVVASLSDEEVNQMIAYIEKNRITKGKPFVVIRKDL